MAKKPTYKAGDTRKSKKGLLRLSSTGKWFKTSNSPAAQKQRDMNTRLDAPIANLPGTPYQSQTTERQLAHEAAAATTTRYGGTDSALGQALTQAVQHQSNVNGYYDDYRASVKDLTDQATAYNAGAVSAMQNLPNLVTGLAGQAQGQIGQQQAQRGPEMGAIGAGTTNTNASNAAAISQAAAGSYGAQAQLVGNANQQYNANLLNNVIPAQKIQANTTTQQGITNAQKDITAQKGVEGAYNEDYRNTRRQDETKNLLAGATLNLNTAKATTTADQNSPAGKAAAATATNEARVAANHGYSLHDWRLLGNSGRAKIIAKDKKTGGTSAGDKVYSSGPFAGRTQAEIQAMSQSERDALIAKTAKGPKKGKGPVWVSPEAQNKAGSLVARMKGFTHQLQVGHPPAQKDKDGKPVYPPGVKPGVKYTRTQAASILRQNPDMDEALLSAVLDANYNQPPHLSPYTVRKLIAASYKPSQIASALGVPTRKGMKSTTASRAGDAAANAVKRVF